MEYIWITRWPDFQHYRPERDRPPAWIKDYPKQLDDERYLRLTDRQRALLRDLRDVFATSHGRLPDDQRMITRRRNSQTRHADLDALNHAGFIEVISRETLEQRLELLYSSPRTPARSKEKEVDRETPKPPFSQQPKNSRPVCSECGTSFKSSRSLAEHLYHSHNGPEPQHWLEAETHAEIH